ncbi:hypothetical protein [Piscirickettsia litoralis]|uniref:Spo0E like sporulation regulatory protein n=1 Tax=Piscirickettsia litoralis TaxID=1891921 RepID=A0ABX2ZYB3_9GAMM|nr:hypothetical protein [Piscirickettsia litoralis]ODN41611.1 hypothetical protein BGC07_16085 [Piscirickettsia litoralis]
MTEQKLREDLLNLSFEIRTRADAMKRFFPSDLSKIGKINRLLDRTLDLYFEVLNGEKDDEQTISETQKICH